MERVQQLEEFLREEPGDPFNYYALALEYLKTDKQKAAELFALLLDRFPKYLPTYYPYAHLLLEMGDIPHAEQLFKVGMAHAQAAGENKTLRELQTAYNDWLFERG